MASAGAGEGPRSIGEVVKGLHGGKYQFDNGGFAGGEFAASLAASGGTAGGSGEEEAAAWPRWALAMRAQPESSEELVISAGTATPTATVVVTNRYRSWERWHAAVVRADGSSSAGALGVDAPPYAVDGAACGDLAPRGGANNVCDETKPYLDNVEVAVRCVAPQDAGGSGEWALVVATEEEQWTWRLGLG